MNLKPLLEETLARCPQLDRRNVDPVGLVWAYEEPRDREVVALVASCLAYGQVALVRQAIAHALEPLGAHPATTLRETDPVIWIQAHRSFRYRMTSGADLADLFSALHHTLRSEGSLEALYASDCSAPVAEPEAHLEKASRFVKHLRKRRLRPGAHRGFTYLLPDPEDGSACKRLHLFFRWMGRGPDRIDLGQWQAVDPAALIMPLDTHTGRICRYLGLTSRKAIDARAALEVTRRLKALHPTDPLRYDFPLCHLGISGGCIHRRSDDHCPSCPIEPACVLAAQDL
jgi:uncharacterized protein (TIGR02757 family)